MKTTQIRFISIFPSKSKHWSDSFLLPISTVKGKFGYLKVAGNPLYSLN